MTRSIAILIAALFASTSYANVKVLRNQAETDYPSLIDALQASQDGDVLTVAAGVTSLGAPLDITKSITLQGTTGPDATTLDFSSDMWLSVNTAAVTLKDMSFTGIASHLDASAVALTIENCHFTSSTGSQILYKVETGSAEHPLSISDSTFTSTGVAPKIVSEGGLVQLGLRQSSVSITSTKFTGGKAKTGGCLWLDTDGGVPRSPHGTDYQNIEGPDVFHFPITLTNVEFQSCHSEGNGGAVYVDLRNAGTQMAVQSTLFKQNTAVGNGGGLFVESTPHHCVSVFSLGDVEFNGNVAVNGGGLYLRGDLSLNGDAAAWTDLQEDYTKSLKFIGNHAVRNGGGFYVGASTRGRNFSCDFLFKSNTAGEESSRNFLVTKTSSHVAYQNGTEKGGAIYVEGLQVKYGRAEEVQFTFKAHSGTPDESLMQSGNKAQFGGFLGTEGRVSITNLYTKGNVALKSGGAVYSTLKATISNSHFREDTAIMNDGGAVRVGIDNQINIPKGYETALLSGVTIKHARAGGNGGAIAIGGLVHTVTLSNTQIVQCIAGGDAPAVYYKPGGTPGRLVINEGSLIYANNHATSAAIKLFGSVRGITKLETTGTEYRSNTGGHIELARMALDQRVTIYISTQAYTDFDAFFYPEQDIQFISTRDYFDASPASQGHASIKYSDKVTVKKFTDTFLATADTPTSPSHTLRTYDSDLMTLSTDTTGLTVPTAPPAREYTTTPAPPKAYTKEQLCAMADVGSAPTIWDGVRGESQCLALGACWNVEKRTPHNACYAPVANKGGSCNVPEEDRTAAGFSSTGKFECVQRLRACFNRASTAGAPNCYYPTTNNAQSEA